MELRNYHPLPKLVTKVTEVTRPRFPAIDAHNHLGEPFGGGWDKRPLVELLDCLDEAGVVAYVDLDGGWGEATLQQHLAHFKEPAPDRFAIFGGVDWAQWAERGNAFPEWAAGRMRAQARWGAQGLKIWKPFGLSVRDHARQLVVVDDARLDPIWQTAAELNWPVMIHVADPVAFFDELSPENERWEELQAHPDWHIPSPPYPPFAAIMAQLASLVGRHPETVFIGAHAGCYAENMAWVGELMERCPNFYIDISARLAEIGRQPYTARRFFLEHAKRILFGTDAGPSVPTYRLYYRFLETDDEYFNYSEDDPPPQGRWHIYGLHLPDDVLRQVYSDNIRRLLAFPAPVASMESE